MQKIRVVNQTSPTTTVLSVRRDSCTVLRSAELRMLFDVLTGALAILYCTDLHLTAQPFLQLQLYWNVDLS